MKEWIKRNFDTQLEDDTFILITNFSVTWMIFEDLIAKTKYKKWDIDKYINKINFNQNDIDNISDLFQSVKDYCLKFSDIGCIHRAFRFDVTKNDINEKSFEELYEAKDEPMKKLKAFFWLAFRFRNNLFHGSKRVENLNDQKVLFRIMTDFLRICVDAYRR